MLQQVQEAVRAVLGGDIGTDQPLMAAGLDSLSSVEFRNSLEAKLGVDLPTTLVFDYPTVAALAEFLAKKVPQAGPGEEPPEAAALAAGGAAAGYGSEGEAAEGGYPGLLPAQQAQQRVAISSMVVRTGADAFGSPQPVDAITLVPATRWDLDLHEDLFSGLPVRFCSFLPGVARFDSAALGVSDGEAVLMDPQQRQLLEMAGELLLGSPAASTNSRQSMGVFVGLSSTDYAKVRGVVVPGAG